jgi:hypothetical protein
MLPLADALPVLPHPAPGRVAGGIGGIHAEAADRARQPFRKIALTAVAGGDAAPNSYLYGCATAAIVSATDGRNPCTCLRQNRLICVRLLSEVRSDGLAGRCAPGPASRPAERLLLPHLQQRKRQECYPKTGRCSCLFSG